MSAIQKDNDFALGLSFRELLAGNEFQIQLYFEFLNLSYSFQKASPI